MTGPLLSIVVGVHNESENIAPLLAEITSTFTGVCPYEIIYINDASTDDTLAKLQALRSTYPDLRVIDSTPGPGRTAGAKLPDGRRSGGLSSTLWIGAKAARGALIGRLDGDCQDDPRDLLPMLERYKQGGVQMIGGVRVKRQDTLSKRLASKAANAIRNFFLKDNCPDSGCGVKLFERSAYLELPVFSAQHRYLPALFQMMGYSCAYMPVNNRRRAAGHSKFTNWQRGLIGLVDMIGVYWLRKRVFSVRTKEV